MQTTTLANEEKAALETEVLPLIKTAKSLVVKNSVHRESAIVFVENAKELKEQIEKRFHPTSNREEAYEHWKSLKDTENAFYSPIDEAVRIVKGAIQSFDRDEALKAQREAAAAEAKRQEEERKQREELEAKAKKAEEKGKIEKAEAYREQAETVTVAPVFTPPTNGVVKKLVTKARVLNMTKLCKLIAEGIVPFSVVEVRESQLQAWAKTQDIKQKFDGIELYQDVNGRI